MSVVKEIPVYLSKQFMNDLLLFEFPNRPKDNSIKASSVADCKYKSKFKCAELSIALDTKSANYEHHRGKELGQLASEQFPRGQFDRQLFRSLPHPPSGGQQQQQQQYQRCAVARFHDNRLTVCPMSAGSRLVMQPVLDHLDSASKSCDGAAAGFEEADSAKAVTLRFARQETPEARQRREQSYRACQRTLEQEAWLKCRWSVTPDGDPDKDRDQFLMGIVPQEGEGADLVAMEVDQPVERNVVDAKTEKSGSERYLGRLCPPVSSVSAVDELTVSVADRGAPSVSLARLRAMPCDERLRALFKSACVLRWTQLVDLLKQCGMTHTQLTESLPQIHGHLSELACLVHGQWVVKSEILYPAGTVSMYSGVPAEVLCRGRDYILCRFVQGRTVTRKEVASLVKMPSEEISQILARISRIVRPTGDSGHHYHHHHHQQQQHQHGRAPKMRLAFVMDEDVDYIRRNPDIVKKALYYWEAKWKLLSEQLKLDKAARPFRTASMSSDHLHRSRTRSARYSTSSDVVSDSSLSSSASSKSRRSPSRGRGGGGGGSGRSGAGAARHRMYSRRQCVSMCDESDAKAAAAAAASGDRLPTDSTASRSRSPSVSRDGGGDLASAAVVAAAGSAPSQLEMNIRAFLLTKLQDRLVAGLEELVRFYRAEATRTGGDSDEDPNLTLPASDEACRRLFDAAAESASLVLLQGGSGCRLYAYAGSTAADASQPNAPHRREVLAALKSGNAQVTLAQLRARFESAGLEPLSEAALKNLVKDYCVFRGKAYYAKGYQHGP